MEIYLPGAADLRMKGCFNASEGVHLFSGFKARHLSIRSMKRLSSLVSTSVSPLDADTNLVRRSRVGFVIGSIFTTSWSTKSVDVHVYETRKLGEMHLLNCTEMPGRYGEAIKTKRTLPVSLSCSTLLKFIISSKCIPANWDFFSIFVVNLPRHSMIDLSIWLLLRPVNKILPVYSSYRVQPMDHTSIAQS